MGNLSRSRLQIRRIQVILVRYTAPADGILFRLLVVREKPDGNAWLEYWNGLTAGTIEGLAADIKITFAEIFPFPHIMDALRNRIDGITNDSQCRELIEFIETRPIAEYENSGRAWLEKFLIENTNRAFELLPQNGGKFHTYEESE
ncbi:hypothetical protein FOZ60_017346 [Perkinsus olseni]|uniref:Uncharacterized protein n=1 Tax=Perkinsus olseni TaxID=32597 RepID=A0A7J6N0P1_PEROL|nr:hypothetical protein FOZ60_017346 [Perkinsus olseni]